MGKNRISQIRKTHCTHYIISWKEEVGHLMVFVKSFWLYDGSQWPVQDRKGYNFLFLVCWENINFILFLFETFYFQQQQHGGTLAEHNKGSSWLVILVTTSWVPENCWDWWEKLCPWLKTFYIKTRKVKQFIFYFEFINWSWWCLTILLKFSNVIINYNF